MKHFRIQVVAGAVAGFLCLLLLAVTAFHLGTRAPAEAAAASSPGYLVYSEVALVVLLALAMVSVTLAITSNFSFQRDSRRKLSESEERYRSLLFAMTEGMLVHDPQGRVTECNPSAAQILGLSARELVGRSPKALEAVLLREDGGPLPAEAHPVALALASGRAASGVLGARRADGTHVWFLIHCQPLRHGDGAAPHAVLSTLVDITPQKRAEEELRAGERRLRAIIEDQTELICRFSTAYRLTFVNDAFCHFFEYRPETLLGAPALPLILGEQGVGGLPVSLTPEMPFYEADFLVVTKSRRLRWTRWTIRAIFHERGEAAEYQAVGRDIHELRRVRESLLALNEDLEARVERRTGQLAEANKELRREIREREAAQQELLQAKERAESANRAKTDFLAMMSHEIRTPMQSIMGFAELLRLTPLTPEQEAQIGAIRSQNGVLMNIINDILDFAKIQSGRLALEHIPFRPRELAAEAAAGLQPLADQKNLLLRVLIDPETPDSVLGDPNRLRQVLNNLLGNAIKFTARGAVTLALRRQAKPGAGTALLEFEVHDTGPGIPAAQLPDLFQEFHRLDTSSTREHQGTGLGLAISKRLCRMMGGDISAASEPGQGSRFRFTLPFKVAPIPSLAPAAEGAPEEIRVDHAFAERHPLRILLAEDNAMAREVLFQYLALFGYRPLLAGDGVAALEMARAHAIDLLFMDLHMPKMDGIATTREIRRGALPRQPWIIGTTANVILRERQRCHQAGMNDYLAKPILPRDLRRVLDRYLAARAEEAGAAG
jgi:PAS domain S-box-containing protein